MTSYKYHRVDVFTDRPFGGNPLAVFPDAEGLDPDIMQVIAREMNLSETVFCLPPLDPEADVRLRIFTVDRELPMAGHPVVGTHFVLAATGRYDLEDGSNEVCSELQAGVLPVEVVVKEGEVHSVVMDQNCPEFGEPFLEHEVLAEALGLDEEQVTLGDLHPRVVDTGIPWFLIPVVDLPAVRSIQPKFEVCHALAEYVGTDLFHAFTQETGDPDCAVRTRHVWFGTGTPSEDPVTGSAAGCIASYLVSEEVVMALPTAEISIEQGDEVGRPGKIQVLVDVRNGEVTRVRVGGRAVHIGDGTIWL